MTNMVSIALASYNGEKFIRQQLDSILNQTYENLEIIICDDNSEDKTVEIIKRYKDIRIKLYKNQKKLGVIKNFEKALSLCTGNYIAISDQDDIWVKNKIETLLSEIDKNILIYHDDSLIDEEGNLIYKSFFNSNEIIINKEHNTKALVLDNWISGHACMFSSSLKKHILPINQKVEHYDMWIAIIASRIGKIKYLNKQLVYWRQHHTNTSRNKLKIRNIWQKIFTPIDNNTLIIWNKNRIERLRFLKEQKTLEGLTPFIDNCINYYSLSSRFKALYFAIFNIEFIIQKRGILRKLKYILLPLYAPRIKID